MYTSNAATSHSAICGWAPSNDDHDSVYTTIPIPQQPTTAHPNPPSSSSTHPPVRRPIPRSLSLDSSLSEAHDDVRSLSRFKNATSLRRYKVKRSKDPTWAPRPPNAFILFRNEYTNKHKGVKSEEDEAEKPKLTLSKRAGKAWRALSPEEQRPYFDAAKIEADEHSRRNPNYQFKPNKHSRSESRRHPALLSRRERVEEFIRQSSRRRSARSRRLSRDGSRTPGSVASSSPEPPDTPASHESAPRSDSRSSSRSCQPQVACPIPLAPGSEHHLSVAAAMHMMPPLASDFSYAPPLKRAYSYSAGDTGYSPWEFLSFDDCYTECDNQSVHSMDSSQGEYSPVPQSSPSEFGATLEHMSEPIYMPAPGHSSPPHPSSVSSMMPSSSDPLIERRRRSATTSMITSPLTVITSPMSGWPRDDQMTARMVPRGDMAAMHPTYVARPQMPDPQAMPPQAMPMPELQIGGEAWHQPMSAAAETNGMLTMAMADVDLDRTPRIPVFPSNSQGNPAYTYPQQPQLALTPPPLPSHQQQLLMPMSTPEYQYLDQGPVLVMPQGPFDLVDVEPYNMGLRNYGISGMPQDPYGSPGVADAAVDYSSLYLVDPCEQG